MSKSASAKRKASRILYPVRKAKNHYVYDRREVMNLYDVTRNTIANWESSGLANVEGTNALFRSNLLNAFHKDRKRKIFKQACLAADLP